MAGQAAASRSVTLRPDIKFNGVKVFSATMFQQRENLGETVTEWITAHPHLSIVEMVVSQSSDESFHCIAISVFYFEPPSGR